MNPGVNRLAPTMVCALAAFALALPAVAHAKGPVRAFSFGGDVRRPYAPRGGSVTTFGGDVRIGSVEGPLRALTFGGDVDVDTLASSARITTFGGAVRFYLAAADAAEKISVRTYGGDVRIELDPDLDATIEIEQVCRRGDRCHVASDVPLTESVGKWKRRLFGGVRRTVRSTATIGDGKGANVRIRVEGADVTLMREAVVAQR